MPRIYLVFLVLLLIFIPGCNKQKQENTTQPQPAKETAEAVTTAPPQSLPGLPQNVQPEKTQPVVKETPAPKIKSKAVESKPVVKAEAKPEPGATKTVPAAASLPAEESAPAELPAAAVPEYEPVQQPDYVVIPSGTYLRARLQSPLDSAVNVKGDTFQATLDKDIIIEGKTVVPRGSILNGKVSYAARAGRVQGKASMSLQLIQLRIHDTNYPIQSEILNFEADSSTKNDVGKVGIASGIGAVIGAIAGGGKGAAIGAAAGAGAGGVTVLATRGKEVKLEAEQQLNFELQRDIRIELPRK